MNEPKKTKRPDVARRIRNRLLYNERAVSCSLRKRLGINFDPECRRVLGEEIDRWVISTSKIIHRLSIIFNRLLLYLLKRDMKLPSFSDAFFSGLALHGMKKTNKKSKDASLSLIEDFCSNEFDTGAGHYPVIERQRGDCQAVVIAAQRYKTNFKNTIHVPFYIRQEKYIRIWCRLNNVDAGKKQVRSIQCQIDPNIRNWCH